MKREDVDRTGWCNHTRKGTQTCLDGGNKSAGLKKWAAQKVLPFSLEAFLSSIILLFRLLFNAARR